MCYLFQIIYNFDNIMEWITLIALLVLGIGLIVVEIIFIPGTTLVGILGFVCLIGGSYSAYESFGSKIGNIVIISTGIFLLITTIYALKSNTWKKLGLPNQILSKVNDRKEILVYEGCKAIAVSDLKPIGIIEFENHQYEAESNGEFIEAKSIIEVIKANRNQIIVKKQNI